MDVEETLSSIICEDIEVVCRDVWIVEKPQQKHNSPLYVLRIEGLNPDCHSRIQDIQLPPRFRRQSQTVVGNSWDFGEARISFESLWKLLSSSPECLFTTSRCGWPVASIASLGCELRKHKGDKFVPLSRQGRIFLSANRSQSRSPNRRWRYLQDRGASSMHSPYLDEEL